MAGKEKQPFIDASIEHKNVFLNSIAVPESPMLVARYPAKGPGQDDWLMSYSGAEFWYFIFYYFL